MNAEKAQKLQQFLEMSTLGWIGLIVAIFALAFAIHAFRSWYRGGADAADADDEILQQMEVLHREGDLTDEEFRSIKSQITERTNI